MANVLRKRGVGRGDTVTIYLPMIPEAAYAMLACGRLGAIHSVVFGGFSPDSLASRIEGCGSKIMITADEGVRGGRKVPLKANVDAALKKVRGVDHVVVVHRTGGAVEMQPGRDVYYHDAAKDVTDVRPCEEMNAEDPLFILYTSGSTGHGASGRSRSHPRRYRDPAESPYEGSDCRDCQDFCVRRFPSCAHEALFEHDGELRLRLGPLSRRSFPIRNGVVQNQI